MACELRSQAAASHNCVRLICHVLYAGLNSAVTASWPALTTSLRSNILTRRTAGSDGSSSLVASSMPQGVLTVSHTPAHTRGFTPSSLGLAITADSQNRRAIFLVTCAAVSDEYTLWVTHETTYASLLRVFGAEQLDQHRDHASQPSVQPHLLRLELQPLRHPGQRTLS